MGLPGLQDAMRSLARPFKLQHVRHACREETRWHGHCFVIRSMLEVAPGSLFDSVLWQRVQAVLIVLVTLYLSGLFVAFLVQNAMRLEQPVQERLNKARQADPRLPTSSVSAWPAAQQARH